MSGSVIDKATALKHSVGGSTINKIVCKASSHDLAGPKKKHVDFLITLTNNPQVSMPTLADMIGERLTNTNWIVVMKALITAHNLITLGNEKFLQCLATRTNPFDLETFSDRSTVLASDMTRYVHKYSRYLGAYCNGYRTIIIDIYRVPRGDKSPFKSMDHTKLLKASSVLQGQMDLLLEVDISQGELTNGVINTAFLMLYKDLIKLYAVYNDALLNVLDHFFEMKKSQCKEAIEIYRKFLTRQENVHNFLKLAEEIGVDQKSHLNLRQVPADLLQALEQHLSEMDAIRKSASNQKPSPQIKAASEKLSELKDQPSSGSGSNTPTFRTATPTKMPSGNEEALEAQKKRFEELKKRASEKTFEANPFTPPTAGTSEGRMSPEGEEFDKIAASRSSTSNLKTSTVTTATAGPSSGLDELLDFNWSGAPIGGVSSTATASVGGASSNPFAQSSPWGGPSGGYQEVNLFPSQPVTSGPGFDPIFGGAPPTASAGSTNGLGELLQPVATGPLAAAPVSQSQPKRLTSDVDSSLAQAAANLSIELTGGTANMGTSSKSTLQWSGPSPQQTTLTGGPMYQRTPMIQPTTFRPVAPQPAMFGGGGVGMGYFPNQPMPQQQPMFGGMGVQPAGFQQGWPQAQGMGMGGAMGGAGMYSQGPFTQQQRPFF